MKRSEALQQLSRDHQHALAVALELRRAGAGEEARARERFLGFWGTEGAHHFRVEEDVLLPGCAAAVSPTDPAVVRVLTDHVEIRRRAADLAEVTDPPASELNELGELLKDHVRHEERVLFPAIEQALPPEELERLAQRTEEAERSG
ncbi:MAG TPA: hemerythrin domain-containing protein [Solirubrobacterales bacterium]|jgi:hemerythrin-like domain-containing protein